MTYDRTPPDLPGDPFADNGRGWWAFLALAVLVAPILFAIDLATVIKQRARARSSATSRKAGGA